jgi:hypothetical protein
VTTAQDGTHSRLPIGLERFCEHVVRISARSRLAGSLGVPRRTGFYVQQSVVDRLYAASAQHEPFARPFHLLNSGLEPAVSRSPALSGYRGMRDPEAAEAVDFTVHAGENDCITGDTCKGQKDPISNLTQAMSADIFRVEFHAATSKAKPLAGFIQEVQCILIGLFVPNLNRRRSPLAAERCVPCSVCALCARACRAEAAEGRPGHLLAGCSPRMDRQARHSNAPSRYCYHHIILQSLQSGLRRDLPSLLVYVCMRASRGVRVCVRSCARACVVVAAASTGSMDL